MPFAFGMSPSLARVSVTPFGFSQSDPPYYPQKFCVDIAIRYAVSEDDSEQFRKLADNFFSHGDPTATEIICIAVILYRKKKYEMLDIFIDALNKTSAENLGRDHIDMSQLKQYIDLIGHCFFGEKIPKDKYEKYAQSYTFSEMEAYFAMMAGDTEFLKGHFKRSAEDESFYNNTHFFIMSAIAFQDAESLQIMADSGIEISLDVNDIVFLCTGEKLIKFVCDHLSKHIFKYDDDYCDAPISTAEFIERTIPVTERLSFAATLHEAVSEELFTKIWSELPKINLMYERETSYLHYFSDNHIGVGTVFADTVSYAVETGRDIFSYYPIPDIPGVNVIYDFTGVENRCFGNCKTPEVIEFLKEKNVCFRNGFLTEPVRELLDRNNARITDQLISQKVINLTVLDEIIEYLTGHKLYNCLNVVNRAKIPEVFPDYEDT